MDKPFFKETDEEFICKDCKKFFKSYHYHEDCSNCNDGEHYETGGMCLSCGGYGEHEYIVKDQCQVCLYCYLIKENE